jgi:hypothetical protein
VALIVASLVPAFPPLDADVRATILADVTRFVGSQILALPDFLRLPYRLALTGFEWLPLLRWARPFSALAAEHRAAYVDFWAESQLAPLRNFVKLIRGCALLAFYDHPALVRALAAQAGRTTPPRNAEAGIA